MPKPFITLEQLWKMYEAEVEAVKEYQRQIRELSFQLQAYKKDKEKNAD